MYHHRHHLYLHYYQFRQNLYHPILYHLMGTGHRRHRLDRCHHQYLQLEMLYNQKLLCQENHHHQCLYLHTHPLGMHLKHLVFHRHHHQYLHYHQFHHRHYQPIRLHHQGIHLHHLHSCHHLGQSLMHHNSSHHPYLQECLQHPEVKRRMHMLHHHHSQLFHLSQSNHRYHHHNLMMYRMQSLLEQLYQKCMSNLLVRNMLVRMQMGYIHHHMSHHTLQCKYQMLCKYLQCQKFLMRIRNRLQKYHLVRQQLLLLLHHNLLFVELQLVSHQQADQMYMTQSHLHL